MTGDPVGMVAAWAAWFALAVATSLALLVLVGEIRAQNRYEQAKNVKNEPKGHRPRPQESRAPDGP